MIDKNSKKFDFNRREFASILGATSMFSVFPSIVQSYTNTNMHEAVAKSARKIAAGQELELRLLVPNGSGGNINPVIAAFQSMTGIKVNVIETPVDEMNTELTLDSLSRSRSYDVALPATFGIPDLVASGAIRPISDFAAHHEPTGFRDDILFNVGDSFDGEIYGFQTDGDAYMTFYNKRMMENPIEQAKFEDQFGTPLARPDTWQELDRQMAFFNRPEEGIHGGLLFRTPGYLAWEWWVRFHAKGLWPFSKDMEPQIASAEGVEALEEMILATQNLLPEVSHLGLFENWERFSRGDIYCNIGWGGTQKFLNASGSAMRGNMIYGPTPGGLVDGQLLITPYFNWGWNYVVTSNSEQPEISYLFALFASTPQMSTLAVRQKDGFFDPFRPEHYEDQGIKSAYTPEFLKIHRESMKAAIPDLYLQSQGEYFRTLGEWLTRALAGEVSPKVALERVARRWRLVTDGSGRALQSERWMRLREKYPPHIQSVLRDIS